MKTALVCLLAAVWAVCLPTAAAESSEKLLDEWHVIYLNGQKAGHEHATGWRFEGDQGAIYETVTQQEFTIQRGPFRLAFTSENVIREGADGRVRSFTAHQKQGPVTQHTEGHLENGQMVLETTVGAATTTKRIEPPSGLGPHALRRLRGEKGFEPGTTYSVTVFLAEFPARGVKMDCRVGPPEQREVGGRMRTLHPIHATLDILPGLRATEWVDDQNRTWLTRAPLSGSLMLETRRADEDAASAENRPTDLLEASVLLPDRPIERPRETERVRLLLVPASGNVQVPDLPTGPFQTVKRTDRGVEVSVRRAHPSPEGGYELPYEDDAYEAFLRPNRWLETEEPIIVEMSRQAVGDAEDALAAAQRIEEYVSVHIARKTLALGMATAAQTARQKEGDCTEHAMLTAALARAAGIPARVVEGLAYVPDHRGGIFGYHMWTEAYVGEWLPLDAALGGHDATHLVLARSDLNEPGSLAGVWGMMRYFGTFEIRVLEVTHDPSEPQKQAG